MSKRDMATPQSMRLAGVNNSLAHQAEFLRSLALAETVKYLAITVAISSEIGGGAGLRRRIRLYSGGRYCSAQERRMLNR